MHLFEWEDFPWFPDVIRDAGTAYITKVMNMAGMLPPLVPKVMEAAEKSGAERIIDLCSGAGGPALAIAAELSERGSPLQVHCTDLFPNHVHLQFTVDASDGRVSYEPESVDATQVPEHLKGLRTIFNAFHHMTHEQARSILADSHDKRQPIAIFEIVDRKFANLGGIWLVPFFVALVVPFMRPFNWRWIPLTYLVPIIPLFILWDGFVSCLRIYQPFELRELVDGLDDFDWDIGLIPLPSGPIYATYLVGIPKER